MDKNAKIYIAGHRGLVGSALVRNLRAHGYNNILTRTHAELDLTHKEATEALIAEEKPEYVFLGGSEGRRHPRQQRLSGGVHPFQSRHPDQHHQRRPTRTRSRA